MTTTTPYHTLVADKGYPGSIQTWMDHDGVPSTLIVAMAEQWIYRRVRLREMLATHDGVIAEGADSVELPERYLEPKSLYLKGPYHGKVRHQLPEDIERYRSYDKAGDLIEGQPRFFYADGTHLQFEVRALEEMGFRLSFYRQPEALSAENPRNVLTEKGFRLLMAACMTFAHEWMEDERERERWAAMAMAEAQALQAESDSAMSRNIETPVFAC